MRHEEDPITSPDERYPGDGRTKTSHPAFAQISASRVSGGVLLYGSDTQHRNYITIRILGSDVSRDLSSDWYFSSRRDSFVEVALTEAQWLEFTSSLNRGDGVPCTLQYVMGEAVPEIASLPSKLDQFQEEIGGHFKAVNDRIKEMRKLLESTTMTKAARKELESAIRAIDTSINSNLEFVKKQFDEHVEESIARAKVNINGYLNHQQQSPALTDESRTVEEDRPRLTVRRTRPRK